MSDALAPITASDMMGAGGSLVVDNSSRTPAPGEFVELPVLLSINRPSTEMVREAGIDGRSPPELVGKDGKVKQAGAMSAADRCAHPAGVADRALQTALRHQPHECGS
jgi:hypothetical protein